MTIGVYRGTTQIAPNKIFRGTTPIASVWRGTTKIWPSENLLYEDGPPANNSTDWFRYNCKVTVGVNQMIFQNNALDAFWFARLDAINTPKNWVIGDLMTVRFSVGQWDLGGIASPITMSAQQFNGAGYTQIGTTVNVTGPGDFIFTCTPINSNNIELSFTQAGNPNSNARIGLVSIEITQQV
jgi:hypothetical protein